MNAADLIARLSPAPDIGRMPAPAALAKSERKAPQSGQDDAWTADKAHDHGEDRATLAEAREKLDAALGATRDVVDRGWLSYPHQIGLSGKTVTPKLYIAVGASGSIQHLAGMQTSETIVAFNTDPDAQIFRVADFGIVGDLFEIVPVLTEKLQKMKGRK